MYPGRFGLLIFSLITTPAWGNPEAEDEWLRDDPAERIARVNEGDLAFLTQPPAGAVHAITNELTLDEQSLAQGWVALRQCHDHLDAVPAAQIVYRYRRMRRLEITEAHGIERAWVEGGAVQMEHVGKRARLCVAAQVNILEDQGNGLYRLSNGPYYRRFLDGYYPMHVELTVDYPRDRLRFDRVEPEPQKGFSVTHERGRVTVDAWFEGQLTTRLWFQRLPAAPPP